MPVQVMTSGGMRTLLRLRVMHFGTLRTVRTLKVMDGGSLKLVGNFYDDVAVSITPFAVYGGAMSGQVSTDAATCNVSGGLFPYTYQWTLLSSSGPGVPFAISPTNRITSFRGQIGSDATFRCTVTDSLGTQGSATVFATFADLR